MKESTTSGEEFALKKAEGSLRIHLGSILILTSIFFANFTARIILGPLLPVVESEMDLSHAVAGSLFLYISSAYFIALLASSFISSFLPHKRTIVFSSLALGIALLATSMSHGLWGIRLTLFFVGFAAGPYIASAMATLTTLVPSRHWGKALAIHELAPNLGFVAAPMVAEVVLLGFSWRRTFLFLGLMSLFLTGIFARWGRGGTFRGEKPSMSSYKTILKKPGFWILVILFGLVVGSTLGVFTMLPLYLVTEHGLERSWANTLVSLSRVASLAVVLIGGWAVDRFGLKKVLTIVIAVTGAATACLGIASTSWIAVVIFIQPVIAACFFPAGLAALSLISHVKERNIVVSLTVPISFLVGAGGIPTLIGFIGDMSSLAWGIALIGVLTLASAVLPRFLKFIDSV
ncbi:MAG: MFS transporter [Candidatus Aminicenantes bacterium]|nr:MFS transporter [Candidatus Aminicenantes bacterium]